MKILIIDDERSIRNSLKEILADEGYDVDVAENGQQGCEMVEKEKYDVIFCDIVFFLFNHLTSLLAVFRYIYIDRKSTRLNSSHLN